MRKLILLIIITLVIYYFLFKEKKIKQDKKSDSQDKDLIMCDKCKTFVPEDEIKKIDGKNICRECYDNLK